MSATLSERTVAFEDLQEHFRVRYQRDLRDYNGLNGGSAPSHFDQWCRRHRVLTAAHKGTAERQHEIFARYVGAADGQAAAPAYFDFWHWLLDAAKDIPWTEQATCRWKLTPLPTPEFAHDLAALGTKRNEAILGLFDAQGINRSLSGLPSPGQEAVEVIKRIEADFGRPLTILLKVDC